MRCISQLSISAAVALALTSSLQIHAAGNSAVPSPPSPKSNPTASNAGGYGALPLSFEANRGQADSSVQSVAHGQGYTLLLREGEAVLALSGHPADPNRKTQSANTAPVEPTEGSVIRMKLSGSNRRAVFSEEEQQITRTNYFLGNDPTQWRTDIPNYARVRYAGIYPGVDLVYYGNQRRLEHDFIVAGNADSGCIRLELQGATRQRIDPSSGDLIFTVKGGELRLLKPVSYQEFNGRRSEVASSYRLLAGKRIGFSLGRYNHARPLVIDPVLVYSTYLGGSGTDNIGDQGNGIAVDASGDAYIVGTTYSVNFPTLGALQSQNKAAAAGHGSNVFVSKLNANGTALVYSTYLGGSGSTSGGDFGYGIGLDSYNNAYVTGATYSTDFPITCGAFLTANPSTTAGAPTSFVARLNPSGSGLQYSTYLGGSGNQASSAQGDVAQAIAVSPAGNAYIAGYTYSPDFPTSDAAFQTTFAGTATVSSGFITELNPAGTALVYSTYLGGSGSLGGAHGDSANSIAIDSKGDAFVTGTTNSANFPVTAGAYETVNNSQPNNNATAFVTEINPTGSEEVYSTYLGGSGGDQATAIAVDSKGFAYVAGNTTSSDFPQTANVVEGTNVAIGQYYALAGSGAFAAKLSTDGTALQYSTYLQGQSTYISGLAVDSSGNAYITGNAPTVGAGSYGGFQSTPGALTTPASTGSLAFLVKLDPVAATFSYATLLGGSKDDAGQAIAVDSSGNAYLTGSASSVDFPVSSGAAQTTNKAAETGATNAFVSKFALSAQAAATAYPALPTNIPTTMSGSESITLDCPDNQFGVYIDVGITPSSYGPPPTGELEIDGLAYYDGPVYSDWGGAYGFAGFESIDPPWDSFDAPWSATYYGDSVYAGSSVGGDTTSDGCPAPDYVSSGRPLTKPTIRFQFKTPDGGVLPTPGQAPATPRKRADGPKFTPPASLGLAGRSGLRRVSAAVHSNTASCIAQPPAPYTLSLATMSFTATQGSDNPPVQFFSATGASSWTGTTNQPWLHLYPSNGTPPTTVQVSALTSGLAEGVYHGTISITQAGTTDKPVTIAVTLQVQTPTATPTFSPAAGTYTSAQSVKLGDATQHAVIYYTTDGTTPTTSSTVYSAPIPVVANLTIRAIAVAPLYGRSAFASATYTIKPFAAEPAFSPVAGIYSSAQSVKLADTTTGATIYYTTDGTTPTNASTRYIGAISVKASETIKAIAYASGYTPSPVASALYTIHPPAATPTFTPVGGNYTKAQSVTIADTTTGATIYYTTNGTAPTNASTRYIGAIAVKTTETIKAVAYASGFSASAVASATYTIP